MDEPARADFPLHKYQGAGLSIIGLLWSIYWLYLLWHQQPDFVGRDFFPLYYGALSLQNGHSPYAADVTWRMNELSPATKMMGFAYPMPALLGLWPLFYFSLPIATAIWTGAGAAGSFAAARLKADNTLLFLPLAFWPFFQAVQSKQATLIWFGLCVLLLIAIEKRWTIIIAYCIAVLPAKPQTGIVFALYGVWWAWHYNRCILKYLLGWMLLIWGGSFLIVPDWPLQFFAIAKTYNQFNYTATLLPWGLLLIAATWKLPIYARLAVWQVVIFPITNVYSVLPLLLVWIAVGGGLAYVGAALSMLPFLLGWPNNLATLWAFILVPLLVCCAWRWKYNLLSET